MRVRLSSTLFALGLVVTLIVTAGRTASAQVYEDGKKPDYEPAYVNGKKVMINVIYLKELKAPPQAQAEFYLVLYPWLPLDTVGFGAKLLNPSPPPICNPCDHFGNGDGPDDYHDHVLDSMPAEPGHGEFRVLWHVFVVQPAYTGDSFHDLIVSLAYFAQLPAKSGDAAEALASSTLSDGSPIAVEVDTGFYFVCAVVNDHAGGK